MIDIYELEERYRKYKLKKKLPYIIITVALFFIASLLYFLFNYTQKQQEKEKDFISKEMPHDKLEVNATTVADTNITIDVEEKIKNNPLVESNQTQHQEEQKAQKVKLILTPSISFIKDTHSDIPILYETKVAKQLTKEQIVNISEPIEEKIVIEQPQQPNIKNEPKQPLQPSLTTSQPIIEPEQKGSISIAKKNEISDIEDVIKRFKTNNNPALSLFVAKKYYQMGEYEKSYDYALITNNLNNTIEESWLIFAKSLVKLDKKDKAVETLQKYINHSHSQAAKQLLEEIASGKFK